MPARATLRQPNGPGEAGNVRQQILLGDHGAVEHDFAGDRGAQRELAFDLRRRKSLGVALDDEAANSAVELGPDHRHMGDRRVGDPGLVAGETKAAGDFLGARRHRARIGAVVGLGEAEAAEQLGGRHLRQIFAPLRFAAIGVDRLHGERGLHRHRRAEAGIDALQFARDQAVADVVEAGAAVFLRDGRAEQPELAHFAEDRRIGVAVVVGGDDAGEQLLLRIVARGVAHHALLGGQFAFEVERIVPFERGILDERAFGLERFGFFRDLTHRCSSAGGAPRLAAKLRRRSGGRQAPAVAGSGAFGYLGGIPDRLAPVAQLDRALPSEGRGQGFESLRARQLIESST